MEVEPSQNYDEAALDSRDFDLNASSAASKSGFVNISKVKCEQLQNVCDIKIEPETIIKIEEYPLDHQDEVPVLSIEIKELATQLLVGNDTADSKDSAEEIEPNETKNVPLYRPSISSAVTTRPHTCQICGTSYRRRMHLEGHIVSYHKTSLENGTLKVSSRIYKCTVCHFQTIHSLHYYDHMLCQHGVYNKKFQELKCDQCGYLTYKKFMYKKHLKSHSTVKPFQCTSCDQGYYMQKHLDFHVLTYHNAAIKIEESLPKRIYCCATCDYKTGNQRASIKHMLTHQKVVVTTTRKTSTKKIYKCGSCDFKTVRRQTLAKHALVHGDKKRFTCTACDKGFNAKINFDSHILLHHKFEDNFLKLVTYKIRECNKCMYMTVYGANKLRRHVKNVHEELL